LGGDECPVDLFAAYGKACAPEGKLCSDGSTDICQFGQAIVCIDGKWDRRESFPAPCGGMGGETAGGAAGAAGAAGGAP
jgi:hypothetical protein